MAQQLRGNHQRNHRRGRAAPQKGTTSPAEPPRPPADTPVFRVAIDVEFAGTIVSCVVVLVMLLAAYLIATDATTSTVRIGLFAVAVVFGWVVNERRSRWPVTTHRRVSASVDVVHRSLPVRRGGRRQR